MGLAKKCQEQTKELKGLRTDLRTKTKEHAELMKEIEAFDDKFERYKERFKADKEEKAALKAKIADLQSKVVPAKAGKINSAIEEAVKKVVRKKFWRTDKFIRNEEELDRAGAMIALECDGTKDKFLGKDVTSEAYQVEMKKFVATYGPVITTCLNEYRSTCQSQLKKAWLKFEHDYVSSQIAGSVPIYSGVRAPNPKELLDVALRKVWVDGDDDDYKAMKEAWYLWYWDCLLPLCAGKGAWGIGQRYYGPISSYCPADKPGQKVITSPTEAITCLMYENCYGKWLYEEECKKNKVPVDPKHKLATTLYSDCKVGQNRWGGWDKAGRMKYAVLVGKFKAARRKPRAAKVEEWALNALREYHMIPEKEEKRKASRSRKRKFPEVVVEEDGNEGYVSFAESDVDGTVGGDSDDDIDPNQDKEDPADPED